MTKSTQKNTILAICMLALHLCPAKSQEHLSKIQHFLKSVAETQKTGIEKDLVYKKDTLSDVYPYGKTTREFQWDKIRERLVFLDAIQEEPATWAVLQNYKNMHGASKLVKKTHKNEYNEICDSLGVRRYQSIPLYAAEDSITPIIYGIDGSLVKVTGENGGFIKIATVHTKENWDVPKKYIKLLNDSVVFRRAIFVDRTNQNITTLANVNSQWLVRSMTKATTGVHRPPFDYVTPLGIFVIQEKKSKMVYNKDGINEMAGFAPYASRFSGGAHIHGVPLETENINATLIETSPTLGTTPRSHECVRTVTSHAKFIYDWGLVGETIVFVFD